MTVERYLRLIAGCFVLATFITRLFSQSLLVSIHQLSLSISFSRRLRTGVHDDIPPPAGCNEQASVRKQSRA
jgi:hypothetical protein